MLDLILRLFEGVNKITAKEGYVFRRIHDGMIFGNEIHLGIDYSTGKAREDKREYYEEIVEPEIEEEFDEK